METLNHIHDGITAEKTIVSESKLSLQDDAGKEYPKTPLVNSCRLFLSLVTFLGFLVQSCQRVNLSVAMVCMVNHAIVVPKMRNVTTDEYLPNECMHNHGNLTSGTFMNNANKVGEFHWPKDVQGFLLSSFFWGFLSSHIIGGWLAQRFGCKSVFGYSILGSSIATLLMPIAARTDYRALFVLRVISGVFQGVSNPATNVLWSRWGPPLERQTLCAIVYSGAFIGTVITFPVVAILCDNGFDGGWPSAFYIIGLFGVLLCLAWPFLVYDTPDKHPRITDAERDYICYSLQESISFAKDTENIERRRIPWRSILTSKTVWAIIITHMFSGWSHFTFLTNIPTYIYEVLHLDTQQNGLVSALSYVCFVLVVNVSAVTFDVVQSRKLCSRTLARKIGNTIGFVLPGLLIIGVGYMNCDQVVEAVVLLVTSIAMSGLRFGAGFVTSSIEIAPQYAGVIVGISGTFSTLSGIIAPIVIGYITTNQLQSEWRTVFFITSSFCALGAGVFLLFGSGEIQDWARVSSNNGKSFKNNRKKSSFHEIDVTVIGHK